MRSAVACVSPSVRVWTDPYKIADHIVQLQDIFERIRMSSKPKHREHLQHKINITLDRKRAKTVFK